MQKNDGVGAARVAAGTFRTPVDLVAAAFRRAPLSRVATEGLVSPSPGPFCEMFHLLPAVHT
jgi:hypothetical protein